MGRNRRGSGRRLRSHSFRQLRGFRRPLGLEPLEERRMLAVLTVTTNLDVVDFADGKISLREAIFVANTVAGPDEIVFDFGHAGPETIVLTQGELAITDSLSIIGAGADLLAIDAVGNDPTPEVINGDGSRVLNIGDGINANVLVVALHGVTIRGGDVTGDGGGILSREDTSLVDSNVIDNHATGSGGIRQLQGVLRLLRTEVLSNTGNQGGGISVQFATLDIQDSTISQNIGQGSGGGISVHTNSVVSIARSTISYNTDVVGGAGGIWARDVQLTIVESAIEDNTAGGRGGGMEVLGNSKFTMIDSSVRRNHAAGGVVGAQGSTLGGGGLFVNFANVSAANSDWLIRGSTIADNTANYDGGGIYVVNSDTIQGYGTPGSSARLRIEDSRITGNKAKRDGGGIFAFDVELVIENSLIANNEASGFANPTSATPVSDGGGLFASRSNVKVLGTVVRDNSASANGGGIAMTPFAVVVFSAGPAEMQLRDSTVSGNTAGRLGGGVYLRDGSHGLVNSTIVGNEAELDGGGIYTSMSTVGARWLREFFQITVSGNRAQRSGGGIWISGLASVAHSTIVDNIADSDSDNDGVGGGIVNEGENIVLSHVLMARNLRRTQADEFGGTRLIKSVDYSLFGDTSGSSSQLLLAINSGEGNIVNVDPLLGPLSYNGGPVYLDGSRMLTYALLPGSPGIENGDPLGGMPLVSAGYRNEVLVDLPQRYYRLEDPFTLANDELLGGIASGTFSGNVTLEVPGAIAGTKAAQFNGTNGRLEFTSTSSRFRFGPQFTIETWGRSTGETWNASGWLFNARGASGLVINPIQGTKSWSASLYGSDGVEHVIGTFAPDASVDIREWHHYAISWDSASGAAKMYFDGVEVASQVLSLTRDVNALLAAYVGYNHLAPAPGPAYGQGAVDELAVYGRVLTAEELWEHVRFAEITDFDQRGEPFTRVADGDDPADVVIDIGAYERQAVESYHLVVDTLADESDGNYSAGDFSLREAIGLANSSAGKDVIEFDPALWAAGPATILLTMGELPISDAVTIEGPGASLLTIDASGNDATPLSTLEDGNAANDRDGSRVFLVDGAGSGLIDVEISGLTLTGGDAAGDGGAVKSTENLSIVGSVVRDSIGLHGGGIHSSVGSLTVLRSTVRDNAAFFDGGGVVGLNGDVHVAASTISGNATRESGGGIEAYVCDLTVTGSTISGNRARIDGGGIDVVAGSLQIRESTVSDNEAWRHGGGIIGGLSAVTESPKVLTQVTLSGNRARGVAGGILGGSKTTIRHSTIAENVADSDDTGDGSGGGVFGGANITVEHTIVANNLTFDVPDDWSTEQTANVHHSLIEHVSSIHPIVGVGNILGQDPQLGPLANNGGPTKTHALLPSSPAIDAGNPAAVAEMNDVPEFDQRFLPWSRVVNGDAVPEATIDIGAVEWQGNPLPGDYNFNGVVDAADYSVWMDTVGSTIDLRADGSSAENAGVPDGVVDEHDNAFWKANFGNVHEQGVGSQESGVRVEQPSGNAALAGELRLAGVGEGGGNAVASFVTFKSDASGNARPARRSSPAVGGADGGRAEGIDAALVVWVARRGGGTDVEREDEFDLEDGVAREGSDSLLEEVFAGIGAALLPARDSTELAEV